MTRKRREEIGLPMRTIFANLLIGEFASENLSTELRKTQCFQRFIDRFDQRVEKFDRVMLIAKVDRFAAESKRWEKVHENSTEG